MSCEPQHSWSELPVETMMSMEADLAFRDDADERKSDQVDGLIVEDSQFHATYAYYAQGVTITTATLPTGFTISLLRAELVDEDVLTERAGDLPLPGGVVQRARTAVVRCARRARLSESPDDLERRRR